jgi:hypothetical protein
MLVDQIAFRMTQIKISNELLNPKQLRALCLKQEQAVFLLLI